ncbi:MAG: hypothetical protein WCG85_10440 [Polyangia bacterium]
MKKPLSNAKQPGLDLDYTLPLLYRAAARELGIEQSKEEGVTAWQLRVCVAARAHLAQNRDGKRRNADRFAEAVLLCAKYLTAHACVGIFESLAAIEGKIHSQAKSVAADWLNLCNSWTALLDETVDSDPERPKLVRQERECDVAALPFVLAERTTRRQKEKRDECVAQMQAVDKGGMKNLRNRVLLLFEDLRDREPVVPLFYPQFAKNPKSGLGALKTAISRARNAERQRSQLGQ